MSNIEFYAYWAMNSLNYYSNKDATVIKKKGKDTTLFESFPHTKCFKKKHSDFLQRPCDEGIIISIL